MSGFSNHTRWNKSMDSTQKIKTGKCYKMFKVPFLPYPLLVKTLTICHLNKKLKNIKSVNGLSGFLRIDQPKNNQP
ncbi:hypothetical protein JCM18694_31330 [Prolixibacter denitrificans]|uniref:Uncharacterized protein n=1 Tax=Prolixibacter denitrificans TaxID=1541063 RepID=A0ABQ0ZN77_9BACT|nr:hypothetical protein JCM18694_31330 [Prolixibacter denitrificans]